MTNIKLFPTSSSNYVTITAKSSNVLSKSNRLLVLGIILVTGECLQCSNVSLICKYVLGLWLSEDYDLE